MSAANPSAVLEGLWHLARLPDASLTHAHLTGTDPVFASSFSVAAAAQSTIAAAALAACELGHLRGTARQDVAVDATHAAAECLGWFSIDGREPPIWDKFSGLYRCRDGWVRVHANFRHHREGALRLLGLAPDIAERKDAERAMAQWNALEYEQASFDAGLVATALRSFEEWDATEAAKAIAGQPLFTITRVGDAAPLPLPSLAADQRPLHGVRVLDLTRILAGPVGGRALAAYGADVMLVNAPHLPNIEAIADTSRGKRSALVDLRVAQGREQLDALLADAHVFVQGYRPGGLQSLGYGPAALAAKRPGIVAVTLSAWGAQGPWKNRRGFDSLVQAATGFNVAEARAAGTPERLRPLPMQILDQASGYLMAFGAAVALCRQQREGGSWHVEVSLAQTGHWIRQLGRVDNGFQVAKPSIEPFLRDEASSWGVLRSSTHSARLSRTPAAWPRPSQRPGESPPSW